MWTQVLAESEELKHRLYDDSEALAAHWVTTEAYTLVRDLAEAGRMLHDARETDRRDLWLDLQFWAGVRRMATGAATPTPPLEPFGEQLTALDGDLFIAQATAGDGIVEVEVRDLNWRGSGGRFVARGCRLHGGSLNSLAGDELRLPECSLLSVSVDGRPGVFELAHARLCGKPDRPSKIDVTVGRRIDAAATVMRFVELTVRLVPGGEADFSEAELASQGHRNQVELVSLAGIEQDPRSIDGGAVTFRDCELRGASFRNAALQGVRFEDCDLRDADFTDANLEGAQFDERCRLAGAAGIPANVDLLS